MRKMESLDVLSQAQVNLLNVMHPKQQSLSDYVSGKLDEQAAAMVKTHVANCPECEITLQSIEANSDSFVAGLRGPEEPSTEIFAREAEFPRASETAANLPEVTAIYGQPTAISATPPNQATEQLLQKLGSYELVTKIGEGGMGAVYKAQHEHLGKTVAIKILPATALRDPELVARFRREMKAVGALHHPNIVGAHDAGEANGVHFLVMEYVAGKDLAALLKLRGPLSVEQAISCTLQAARGLEFAHHKGIVHRDIKPANLLLDEEGTLKILDMGLARLDDNANNIAAQEGLTQTGQVMGTVDFMAPEQAFDTHRADAKADVYSLGCTLYRILTGKNAFAGETIVQKILAHREQPIPSLRTVRPDVSQALDAIYLRMMAKQPEQRIGMSEVVKEFAALQAAPTTITTEPFTRLPAPTTTEPMPVAQSSGGQQKPPRRRLVGGLSAAAAAAIVLTVVFIIRDKDGKELARVNGPDGSSVTVQPKTAAEKTPVPSVIISSPPPLAPDPNSNAVSSSSKPLLLALSPKLAFESPDFSAWADEVARRDPETQVAMVIKKLQELNPGYDGTERHRIQNNEVNEFTCSAAQLNDLSPVRALRELKTLKCTGNPDSKATLTNLAPLAGMQLTKLDCYHTKVADLAPLRGMPLTSLGCFDTNITDLSALAGMPLTLLWCYGTEVSDLSPLREMPLTQLDIAQTKVTNLEPLETCAKLKLLHANGNSFKTGDIEKLQKALPNCKIEWSDTEKLDNALDAAAPSQEVRIPE